MKKVMNHSTLYICVLVLMLLELIVNCYQFDFQKFDQFHFVLILLNCIIMSIAYIGMISIADIFLKQEKYEYINLLGMSILALLFSCLLFRDVEFTMNGNLEAFSMIRLAIYQLGSLIKMYIPILIVLCYENSRFQTDINKLKAYKKPIAYITLCTIVAFMLDDYRLLISIMTISLITIILIKFISKNILCNNNINKTAA